MAMRAKQFFLSGVAVSCCGFAGMGAEVHNAHFLFGIAASLWVAAIFTGLAGAS